MTETGIQVTEPKVLYDQYHDIRWIPAPCQEACPVGTDVPSYVGLIWEEKYEDALEAITATNPFSSVCGRVCAMPCETKCRRGESDAPVAIRNLKRFVMERLGQDFRLTPVSVTRSETIGIVGSGPTGLTAAQDLAEAGYEVHVYEKWDRPGGMMNVFPEFRIPRRVIEDDIKRLLDHCPGVKVHLNCALGDQISLGELKKRHDAVFLALGVWRDKLAGIPGDTEGLEGFYGINFLEDLSKGTEITLNGKVIVIGGGNVAMDTARTALRVGAQEVQLYCLEAREEMPAFAYEIDQAEKEGVVINPSWGPKQILNQAGRVTGVEFMNCVSVFDGEGRFNPAFGEKTMMVDAQSVLLSIGLEAANSELQNIGMIERGRVKADFETVRTSDPKIFAAGDCAFGPSAVVYAMNHGHRAAYYIQAFLEGRENPLPYRVPYRTRRVPVAQDPMWEKLPREDQPFLGIGKDCKWPRLSECESTMEEEAVKRQAARCLRCDAETGSSDYSRRTREHIHAMARTETTDLPRQKALLLQRMKPRDNPFPPERPARIDDLVLLSAALTRLVIDPYREACATHTVIGKSLDLKQPFLFTGFDQAPQEVQQALALGLAESGCAYIGFEPLYNGGLEGQKFSSNRKLRWLQLIAPEVSEPRADAAGLVYVIGREFHPIQSERLNRDQLLGLVVATSALEKAIPYALDQGFDLLLLDGSAGIDKPWAELQGEPDLTVMRDAIRLLRKMNREEDIGLLYFGGLRSGTDMAKALAINCNAGVFGVAMGIAIGGVIEGDHITFDSSRTLEERRNAVESWIRATAQETAIIARCTGKTNVHNLTTGRRSATQGRILKHKGNSCPKHSGSPGCAIGIVE
jgi:NADPH-dependent glutamate synthase beta subunit-like oxidoreductase